MLHLFDIDSAGLGDWHVGQAPDSRAQTAAQNRGIDISGQSARQIAPADFDRFDLLLAMDGSNYQELIQLRRATRATRSAASSISPRMRARRTCPIPSMAEPKASIMRST